MIDLLNIEPVKVSLDASSYSMLIHGPSKIGKTSFVHDLLGERVLFIATEDRHKTIANAHVQNIRSWGEYLTVMKQLKNSVLQERYDVVCVDTIENLYNMLKKYVAAKYKEASVGDRDDLWGKDWTDLKSMWRDGLQMIENLGYTPYFIGHTTPKTSKVSMSDLGEGDSDKVIGSIKKDKKTDEEYYDVEKYILDIDERALGPITKMVDNILFINMVSDKNGNEHRVIHLRESLQWQAGSTFKNIRNTVKLSAEDYRSAVKEALGEYDKEFTKEEKAEKVVAQEITQSIFDEEMKKASQLGKDIMKAMGKDKGLESINNAVLHIFGDGHQLTVDTTIGQYQQLVEANSKLAEVLESSK